MAKAIHSMTRVINEQRLVDSHRFAFGLNATYARFEHAGFELRNSVEINRDGSQFTMGTAKNRTLTIIALAVRQPDHMTSKMETGTL